MKKLILLSALLITFYAQAQDRDQTRDRDKDRIQLQDHIILQDGQVYQVREGDRVLLQERLTLHDGTIVNPDGSYVQNRKQLRLKDGQCLSLDGKRYKTEAQFQKHIQTRSKAMAQEHFIVRNGQVYRVQNQNENQLQEQAKLSNGTVVNPDGSLQLKNGSRLRLKDGECLDMDGHRYPNEERFMERTELRLRDNREMKDKMKMKSGERRRG